MSFLKSLFSRSKSQKCPPSIDDPVVKVRPVGLSTSLLGKLPPELLLHIATQLSVPHAALFSICCKQLQLLIGDRYLAQLATRVPPRDTWDFLNLMAVDRLDQIVCYHCQKPHCVKNAECYCPVKWTGFSVPVPKCVAAQIRWHSYDKSMDALLGPRFSTPVFQMVIKLSLHGLDYTHLLGLLSTTRVTKIPRSFVTDWVAQRQSECRLIQGTMVHRLQEVYLSAPRSACSFRKLRVIICKHLSFRTDQVSISVEQKLMRYSGTVVWKVRRDFLLSGTSSGVLRCEHCWTDFRYDFKMYSGKRLAMFYTRWSDLGSGPDSRQWVAKLEGLPGRDKLLKERQDTLCDVFEQGRKYRIDDMLSKRKNRKELFRIQEDHMVEQANRLAESMRERALDYAELNIEV